MAEKKKAILLRIPADLADALQRWSAEELRSVNSQIEFLLREAVRKRSGGRSPAGVSESAAAVVFADVYPFVQQVIGELRTLGLTDWAQRVERALSFSGTPGEMLLNLRATLGELKGAAVILPDDLDRTVGGIVRVLARGED
jgi:hypothetical protein